MSEFLNASERATIQAAPLSDFYGNGGVALLGEEIFWSSDQLRGRSPPLVEAGLVSLKNICFLL